MAALFNVENLSAIKKYPTELIILGLISWCTYLQLQLGTINKEKESYILQDRDKMLVMIQENTRVIQQNNILFESLLNNNVQQNYLPQRFGNDPGKGKPENRGTAN